MQSDEPRIRLGEPLARRCALGLARPESAPGEVIPRAGADPLGADRADRRAGASTDAYRRAVEVACHFPGAEATNTRSSLLSRSRTKKPSTPERSRVHLPVPACGLRTAPSRPRRGGRRPLRRDLRARGERPGPGDPVGLDRRAGAARGIHRRHRVPTGRARTARHDRRTACCARRAGACPSRAGARARASLGAPPRRSRRWAVGLPARDRSARAEVHSRSASCAPLARAPHAPVRCERACGV